MEQNEKRELENQLLVMGLARLDDPELIEQLAELVSQWPGDKHDFMRDLLNECDADQRVAMYEAIAPKLKFKALSLAQYESQIALKAGEMISQGRMRVEGRAPHAIEIGGHQFSMAPKAEATHVLVTMRCCRCVQSDQFVAKTEEKAKKMARKSGWVAVPGTPKEMCADCAACQVSEEALVLSKQSKILVTDRRRFN